MIIVIPTNEAEYRALGEYYDWLAAYSSAVDFDEETMAYYYEQMTDIERAFDAAPCYIDENGKFWDSRLSTLLEK